MFMIFICFLVMIKKRPEEDDFSSFCCDMDQILGHYYY